MKTVKDHDGMHEQTNNSSYPLMNSLSFSLPLCYTIAMPLCLIMALPDCRPHLVLKVSASDVRTMVFVDSAHLCDHPGSHLAQAPCHHTAAQEQQDLS